jgi:hypothetical protein
LIVKKITCCDYTTRSTFHVTEHALFSLFQRPRVCILGGGFGGLYTALRLESLEWPSDKKPQVNYDALMLGCSLELLCSIHLT